VSFSHEVQRRRNGVDEGATVSPGGSLSAVRSGKHCRDGGRSFAFRSNLVLRATRMVRS
jgi:hypothetical protein